jgi:hypothetical protein
LQTKLANKLPLNNKRLNKPLSAQLNKLLNKLCNKQNNSSKTKISSIAANPATVDHSGSMIPTEALTSSSVEILLRRLIKDRLHLLRTVDNRRLLHRISGNNNVNKLGFSGKLNNNAASTTNSTGNVV